MTNNEITMEEKINAVQKWYRTGGDEVWGEVKEPHFKMNHTSQIGRNILNGSAKQKHIDWINLCYHYYYVISPRVVERREQYKARKMLVDGGTSVS
jgi:hypothetical protein